MRPLVVLPTYNESENIDRVVRRIRGSLPLATVLVVDDSSPDGTA
ncbi:MAG: glycosyltransferase, partial [Acidimicrobiales bacterium]